MATLQDPRALVSHALQVHATASDAFQRAQDVFTQSCHANTNALQTLSNWNFGLREENRALTSRLEGVNEHAKSLICENERLKIELAEAEGGLERSRRQASEVEKQHAQRGSELEKLRASLDEVLERRVSTVARNKQLLQHSLELKEDVKQAQEREEIIRKVNVNLGDQRKRFHDEKQMLEEAHDRLVKDRQYAVANEERVQRDLDAAIVELAQTKDDLDRCRVAAAQDRYTFEWLSHSTHLAKQEQEDEVTMAYISEHHASIQTTLDRARSQLAESKEKAKLVVQKSRGHREASALEKIQKLAKIEELQSSIAYLQQTLNKQKEESDAIFSEAKRRLNELHSEKTALSSQLAVKRYQRAEAEVASKETEAWALRLHKRLLAVQTSLEAADEANRAGSLDLEQALEGERRAEEKLAVCKQDWKREKEKFYADSKMRAVELSRAHRCAEESEELKEAAEREYSQLTDELSYACEQLKDTSHLLAQEKSKASDSQLQHSQAVSDLCQSLQRELAVAAEMQLEFATAFADRARVTADLRYELQRKGMESLERKQKLQSSKAECSQAEEAITKLQLQLETLEMAMVAQKQKTAASEADVLEAMEQSRQLRAQLEQTRDQLGKVRQAAAESEAERLHFHRQEMQESEERFLKLQEDLEGERRRSSDAEARVKDAMKVADKAMRLEAKHHGLLSPRTPTANRVIAGDSFGNGVSLSFKGAAAREYQTSFALAGDGRKALPTSLALSSGRIVNRASSFSSQDSRPSLSSLCGIEGPMMASRRKRTAESDGEMGSPSLQERPTKYRDIPPWAKRCATLWEDKFEGRDPTERK